MTDKEQELLEEEFLDEQPLNDEDEELLTKVYDQLDMFEEVLRPIHDKAKMDRQIIRMMDPEQDDPESTERNGKEMLQLSTLKSTMNNVVADQMLSMPEAKILPETPDLQEAADDIQDLVHHILYVTNRYGKIHRKRCRDFYGVGTAVTEAAWDQDMAYGKGDIAVIRWPIEAFLWDPTAENIQDCRAVMKVSWHPVSYYREHWPEAGKYVTGDEHAHNDVGMTEGQEDAQHAADEERALLIEYWWREYNASTRRYKVNVAYVAGNALLEKQLDVYDHGMYPFVVEDLDEVEGSLAGDSLTSDHVPTMRYINRYASYADMNARMSSKNRVMVNRSAGIDKEALTDWKTDIIEGDRIDPSAMQWMQTPPFNRTIVDLMTMMQSDLKADSGANQFTRGETTGGIVSGKAINSLIQAGGKVSSMRTEQLKYGFEELVEQIVWLMAQFYDEERTVMITGRKGRREITIDTRKWFGKKQKGAVEPPPYSVQIETSSRDPQRIANQNQMFLEAYTMSAQAQQFFPLSALFEILNIDGKDKILPVIKANEHYQEQMQMLQQQVEQMGQQMAQMQQENQNLREAANETANAVAQMGARRGGGAVVNRGGNPGQPLKVAEAGGGPNTSNAVVDQARNMMGVPTGAELPA